MRYTTPHTINYNHKPKNANRNQCTDLSSQKMNDRRRNQHAWRPISTPCSHMRPHVPVLRHGYEDQENDTKKKNKKNKKNTNRNKQKRNKNRNKHKKKKKNHKNNKKSKNNNKNKNKKKEEEEEERRRDRK